MPVICLGEAIIDLVPAPGLRPSTAASLSIQPGGAPLNVAIGLSRLGAESLFLGCLSRDDFGARLATLLRVEGVGRIPSRFVEQQTRLALIDHLNDQSPFRFYGDAPADAALTRADVDRAIEQPGALGLYVSSLMMLAEDAREVQDYAIERATSLGMPIFCDPNPRPAAWESREGMREATASLLNRCAIGKISVDDAGALRWPVVPADLLVWCRRRFDGAVVVTAGREGCWASIGQRIVHVPAPQVESVDPTGAGDMFFAALIHRFLEHGRLSEDDLEFAATAGALATTQLGAISGSGSKRDIERFRIAES